MRQFIPACLSALALVSSAPVAADGPAGFAPGRAGAQAAHEAALNEAVSPRRLAAWHDLLAQEPHLAGTPGDLRTIERIESSLREMGLETRVHWIWPYLTLPPDEALVHIIEPEFEALELSEPPVEGDPFSSHPGLPPPFAAYSGSGDVTAEVVYANHGTKQDFERLRALGVDVRGKIVVARYGGNYRGYKAKFAEEAGAAGLIIYTDPAQSGYMRGLMYPEGGWATGRQVERGSLATLPYQGDPLTPFREATEEGERLDPSEVALPRIPVQPMGWEAAQRIMQRMKGPGVPDEKWQGALPFPYRLTGGEGLRVRLKVEARNGVLRTGNVIATLPGARRPEEFIVIGCHHDAWGFGACDPLAGTIVLMECARVFADAAQRGERPDRTIVFAAWGAEEQGIIGSTEWVEAERDRLVRSAVAYINLDMAAMGPLFSSSASPTLARLISDATRAVPQTRDEGRTVFQEWSSRRGAMEGAAPEPLALVGSMGGGSDHVGFYFHACVPSLSLSGRGSLGTAYHSNYDNLHWYRLIVGDDYEPARMVTRVLNIIVSRLARADILPIDPGGIGPALRRHLDGVEGAARAASFPLAAAALRERSLALDAAAASASAAAHSALARGALSGESLALINGELLGLERHWMREEGLPDRPWHRSVFMAPDQDSGYSAWPLPWLRWAVERRDEPQARAAVEDLTERLGRIIEACARIEAASQR